MHRNRISALVTLLVIFVASMASAEVLARPALPLVDLDASKLSEGPLPVWENAGSLKGTFSSDGTNPQVRIVGGVKAVDFGGKDHMLSDFKAPASITGDKPWTCIVRTYCRDVSRERTLVSWSNRPENCLEIEYGDAVLWGALGTWSANTTGWNNNVPRPHRWRTLIYTYQGGKDGEFQAWCDGELRVSRRFTLGTKEGRPFVLGACMTGDPHRNPGYTHFIDGAIASVRIFARGFTPLESWRASGFTSAYPGSPAEQPDRHCLNDAQMASRQCARCIL